MLRDDSDFRVFVNIDGIATPFVVTTRIAPSPVAVRKRQPRCLRVDLRPAPDAGRRGKPATLWSTGFHDLAALTEDPALIALAKDSPGQLWADLGIDPRPHGRGAGPQGMGCSDGCGHRSSQERRRLHRSG